MKLVSSKRRMAVIGLTVGLIAGASGLAVAYFTSQGSGTGSAQVGTASPILINQLGGTPLYNSRLPIAANYQASQCFYCVAMTEFGNRINLAGNGGPLSDVVADMANVGTTAGPMNITFTIYSAGSGTSTGGILATDEQSFNVPAAPDGGYGSTYCTSGAGASDPTCGIANFSIDFNFASQNVTLPGTVVYGMSFNDPQNAVNGGVNIQMSTETPNDVGIGSDADPGNLFASTAGGNGDVGGAPGGELGAEPGGGAAGAEPTESEPALAAA